MVIALCFVVFSNPNEKFCKLWIIVKLHKRISVFPVIKKIIMY